MGKQVGLKGRSAFAAVFQQSRIWGNDLLVLRALPNHLKCNRYGFIVSKRVGKAVVRNKVRRRLREGVRTLPVRHGWDIVISARSPAAQADYHTLTNALASLLARARLLAAQGSEEQRP